MSVELYSYYRSSASYRVRIALALKQIPYKYNPVHLLNDGGEQLKPEYKQVNPKMEVPVLIIDGKRLTQSLPIIEYLEESRPEAGVSLMPKDPYARAKCRALAEIINSGIQPIQNLYVLKQLQGNDKAEWAHHFIHRGFVALEQELKETAGKYCFGDTITIADLCLVPQVMNAERFQVSMAQFPIISRINATLLEHPDFKKAHPTVQPDNPSPNS